MRLVILCDPNSSHSYKWIEGLQNKVDSILVIGFASSINLNYSEFENVEVDSIGMSASIQQQSSSSLSKLKYFNYYFRIKRLVKQFKPDLVHSFYASSYGLLGALIGSKRYAVSVWGSDIFDFPKRSIVHKSIIKYVFNRANIIYCTGTGIENEVALYSNTKTEIIPFGIKMEYFPKIDIPFIENEIRLICVKYFKKIYGIESLIESVSLLRNKGLNIRLTLVGDGEELPSVKEQISDLGLNDFIELTGFVRNEELVNYYKGKHIAVVPSLRESFGVSVLEAMALNIPTLISDISGFREVGNDRITTYFKPGDSTDLALKLEKLIGQFTESKSKAILARKSVEENYSWDTCIEKKIFSYQQLINS